MKHRIAFLTLSFALLSTNSWAKVSPAEAAQLGTTLTPMGAELAGNKAGTIPAWTGGLPQKEMARGADPFAGEKPLYIITADTLKQYGSVLTEGQKMLFKTFPKTYKMIVYPTHRSASYPDWFNTATKKNAPIVELTNNGYGFKGTAQGYPFPIPKSGTEVMWNHIMRFNTIGFRGFGSSIPTQADGSWVPERSYVELSFVYNNPKTTVATLKNQNLYAMLKALSPPNRAGTADLLQVPIDRIAGKTGLWEFVPGLMRVRRIGEVGYDNPLFDGLMTHDQLDMFNGPLDKYNIKLLGKKEVLMPYNSYRLYDPKLKYKDIILQGHINQNLARYELHRCWVIEAEVKPGMTHRYKKRTFYLDEDSWIIHLQDIYDERNQFWRTAESHSINFTSVPLVVNGVQVHYDLQSRRYVAINLTNEESKFGEYNWEKDPSYFNPQQLQKFSPSSK